MYQNSQRFFFKSIVIYQIEVLGRPGQKILLEIPGAPESEMIADKMIPRKMPVAGQ